MLIILTPKAQSASLICCRARQWQLRQGHHSNMAARANFTNAMGWAGHDAYMKELTCFAVGDDIKPPGVILSSCMAFSYWLTTHPSVPRSFCSRLSLGDHGPAADRHHVPRGGTVSYWFSITQPIMRQTIQRKTLDAQSPSLCLVIGCCRSKPGKRKSWTNQSIWSRFV